MLKRKRPPASVTAPSIAPLDQLVKSRCANTLATARTSSPDKTGQDSLRRSLPSALKNGDWPLLRCKSLAPSATQVFKKPESNSDAASKFSGDIASETADFERLPSWLSPVGRSDSLVESVWSMFVAAVLSNLIIDRRA